MGKFFVALASALLLMPLPAGYGQTWATSRSPHGSLSIPCQNCHTQTGWKPIRALPEFDHSSYPLRGMHEGVQCTQCHLKPVFSNVSTKCADCHADIHRRRFGASCEQCHSVKGWNVSLQQIKAHQNRFPLVGAHAALECDSCHKNGALSNYTTMSTECYSCHAQDFQKTTGPVHVSAGFSTTCQQCHSMDSWLGVQFDHLKFTGFALTGMHATLDCTACHANGKFKAPASCVGCHLPDFQKANNPNHVAMGLPQTCSQCHTTAAWQPATFDHTLVGFPLTGAHATLQCNQCHSNGNFNLTSKACVSCHLKDFQNTNNPNHAQQGFPQTCEQCHNTAAWIPAEFNHAASGFPLTGAHATTPCAQCHVNNNYHLTNTACVACHLKDYQGTTDPSHVQANFPQTCQQCHNTTSWAGATFNHASTGFALTGAHTTLQCSQCHANGNYSLNSGACANCHMKDYQGATNPNHVQAGFPTDCTVCHNTTAWTTATFNHATTGFPLTGFHATLQCSQCHVNNNYKLTNTACVSCHLQDFQSTNSPNHVQVGFPQQCNVCHNTTAWIPASFNHNNTAFPLTGFHTTVPCASCHVNNNYTTLPTNCDGCHHQDYLSTTNPNHMAAQFPTTCQTCHNTTSWLGATFNHTWFPIYSGTHVPGVWNTCGDCHTNPNNFLVFSCTNCHTHNKSTTDQQHQGVGGYVYNSPNCYQCHPTGQGGG
jgi:NMD protein affecting ribosome stability and mRNA decay